MPDAKWLLAAGYWLLAIGWWLVAGGWWLVAGGCRSLSTFRCFDVSTFPSAPSPLRFSPCPTCRPIQIPLHFTLERLDALDGDFLRRLITFRDAFEHRPFL